MTERSIGPVQIGGLALIVAIAAILAAWGLRALATPADFAARRAALETRMRTVERLAARPGDGAAYPPGAVCGGLGGEAMERMRQDLQAAAVAEGMAGAQVVWGDPTDIGGKIAPLPLRIEAEGSYERVMSYVDRLGRGAPQIFVETADLKARGGLTHLALSGKVFCWTGG